MTEIESNLSIVGANSENVFKFLFDINNHQKLMPSQVTEWWSTHEEAKMKIQGLGSLHLKIEISNPNTYLKIIPVGKPPVDLYLEWHIANDGENSKVKVIIFAELNMMMRMLAEKPLKNLADYMAGKVNDALKEI